MTINEIDGLLLTQTAGHTVKDITQAMNRVDAKRPHKFKSH